MKGWIPAQLNNRQVEYHLFCPREGTTKITIKASGALRKHATGRDPRKHDQEILPTDATEVFQATRELLNSFRVIGLPKVEEDCRWFIELRDERSYRIKITAFPGEAGTLGISSNLNRAIAVFERNGTQGFERSRDTTAGRKPIDRLPADANRWGCRHGWRGRGTDEMNWADCDAGSWLICRRCNY